MQEFDIMKIYNDTQQIVTSIEHHSINDDLEDIQKSPIQIKKRVVRASSAIS